MKFSGCAANTFSRNTVQQAAQQGAAPDRLQPTLLRSFLASSLRLPAAGELSRLAAARGLVENRTIQTSGATGSLERISKMASGLLHIVREFLSER